MSPFLGEQSGSFRRKSGSADPQSWRFKAPFKWVPSSPRRKVGNKPSGWRLEHGAAMATLDKLRTVPSFLAVLATGFPSRSMHIDQLPHEWHCLLLAAVHKILAAVATEDLCHLAEDALEGDKGCCPFLFKMFLWSCAMEVSACVASAFSGYDILNCIANQETAPGSCPPRQWDCQVALLTLKSLQNSGLSQEVTGSYMATDKATRMAISSVCNHDCNRIELTKISKIQMDAHVLCLYECIFSRYRHMF